MEKQTKILIGIAAVGVVAYLIYKNKSSVESKIVIVHDSITPRQQNINDMFSTTDINGIIQNPYSEFDESNFDDYVIFNKITQEEIEVAKKAFPNAPLTKAKYLVANAKLSIDINGGHGGHF